MSNTSLSSSSSQSPKSQSPKSPSPKLLTVQVQKSDSFFLESNEKNVNGKEEKNNFEVLVRIYRSDESIIGETKVELTNGKTTVFDLAEKVKKLFPSLVTCDSFNVIIRDSGSKQKYANRFDLKTIDDPILELIVPLPTTTTTPRTTRSSIQKNDSHSSNSCHTNFHNNDNHKCKCVCDLIPVFVCLISCLIGCSCGSGMASGGSPFWTLLCIAFCFCSSYYFIFNKFPSSPRESKIENNNKYVSENGNNNNNNNNFNRSNNTEERNKNEVKFEQHIQIHKSDSNVTEDLFKAFSGTWKIESRTGNIEEFLEKIGVPKMRRTPQEIVPTFSVIISFPDKNTFSTKIRSSFQNIERPNIILDGKTITEDINPATGDKIEIIGFWENGTIVTHKNYITKPDLFQIETRKIENGKLVVDVCCPKKNVSYIDTLVKESQ